MHIDRALRGIDELRRAISGRSQIQENTNALAQWRLGRVEYMRAGLRRTLAEIGVPAADIAGLLQPIHRGICRAIDAARDRALCEAAHFGDEVSG